MSRNLRVEVFYGYIFDAEEVSEDVIEGDIPAEVHWRYFGYLEYHHPDRMALVVKHSQKAVLDGDAIALDPEMIGTSWLLWDSLLSDYLKSVGSTAPQDAPGWYAVPIYG